MSFEGRYFLALMPMHFAKKLYCNVMPRLGGKVTVSVKEHSCLPMILTIANTDCFVPAMDPITT